MPVVRNIKKRMSKNHINVTKLQIIPLLVDQKMDICSISLKITITGRAVMLFLTLQPVRLNVDKCKAGTTSMLLNHLIMWRDQGKAAG